MSYSEEDISGNRDNLRKKYREAVQEIKLIANKFDARDKHGKITESGYAFITSIREGARDGKNVSAAIEVVGQETWTRLLSLWKELERLNEEDCKLIKATKALKFTGI